MSTTVLNRMNHWLFGRWVDSTLSAFAVLAWSSTFLQLVKGAVQMSTIAQICVFILGAMVLGAMLWLSRNLNLGAQLVGKWLSLAGWRQIVFILLLGIALRVAWATFLPATPFSDGATYVSLAEKLLNGTGFEVAGTYAYWPPGYPLFLTVWLIALPPALAIPVSQIALFVVGAFGIYRLSRQIAGEASATIAMLLFATWPNLIALSSTPEKEALIIALLPWVMYWLLRGSLKTVLSAGIAIGASVLVQPSLQLLIPALALLILIRKGWRFIPIALLFVAGALLVITPWSVRNLQVLGEFRLVSTNAGDVLYRANNPLANGGYAQRGEVDLAQLGELEMDREGRKLAVRWIGENPVSFMALAFEKQMRFMGDDAYGIYATFRADGEKRDSRLYAPLKLLANAWWLLAWLLLAKLSLAGHRLREDQRILLWGWYYLFALHSVFESAGKYHISMIWTLCVVLGALFVNSGEQIKTAKSN